MNQPEFSTYLKAGYPLLLVKTFEESRALSHLAALALGNGFKVFSWDTDLGLCEHTDRKSKKIIAAR